MNKVKILVFLAIGFGFLNIHWRNPSSTVGFYPRQYFVLKNQLSISNEDSTRLIAYLAFLTDSTNFITSKYGFFKLYSASDSSELIKNPIINIQRVSSLNRIIKDYFRNRNILDVDVYNLNYIEPINKGQIYWKSESFVQLSLGLYDKSNGIQVYSQDSIKK